MIHKYQEKRVTLLKMIVLLLVVVHRIIVNTLQGLRVNVPILILAVERFLQIIEQHVLLLVVGRLGIVIRQPLVPDEILVLKILV